MSELKSMIRMDLAILGHQGIAAVLLIVFGFVMGLAGFTGFAVPFMTTVALLLPIHIFTSDFRYPAGVLHSTLPMRRRTVITSHYLTALGVLGVLFILIAVMAYARSLCEGNGVVPGSLLGIAAIATVVAIMLPVIVRFGQKATWIILLGYGLLIAGVFALAVAYPVESELLVEWFAQRLWATVAGSWIIAVVAWLVSYFTSQHLWARRDF